MIQRVPMTPDGHRKLQEKLKHLRSVERPKVIQDIEIARGHGDLSENAEYDAAKDKQGLVNSMIDAIENKLSLAQIIDPKTINQEKIVFGATVSLLNLETEKKVKYQIVGVDESDVDNGRISIESPIARALIGKVPGDEVTVRTPRGAVLYEVVDVEYI
ncbi:transcription elongation factor GreA [bacterium]|nr:transcription elongation factor GreA [bacterium]